MGGQKTSGFALFSGKRPLCIHVIESHAVGYLLNEPFFVLLAPTPLINPEADVAKKPC